MANTRGGLEKFTNEQYLKREAKKEEEKEKKFYAELYGTGVSAGVKVVAEEAAEDPNKKKMCPFFKAGVCDKGKKCKLSHEMDKDAFGEAANIYIDPRNQNKDEAEDKDNINNWDEKKLNEVVNFNSKKYSTNKPTEIVCKHFLDAVDKKIYGWFWVCPNGFNCIYKHALPQGYILKRDMDALGGREVPKSRIEDIIDEQIYHMDKKGLTPVTHEKFLEWKKKRMERKKKETEERLKQDLINAGHKTKFDKILSGKSLFVFNQRYSNVIQSLH